MGKVSGIGRDTSGDGADACPPERQGISSWTSVLFPNTSGENVLDFVKAKAHQIFVGSMEIMTGAANIIIVMGIASFPRNIVQEMGILNFLQS